MATTVTRNNIIAGVFLIVAIVAAVAVSAVISGVGDTLRPTRQYVVRFSIEDGAAGLSAGSPVAIGGQAVGRVTSVRVRLEGDGSPAVTRGPFIEVLMRVRSDLMLHDDATVFLVKPLLGSESWLNIADAGNPQLDDDEKPSRRGSMALRGQIAPPEFLAQAGYGPTQADQIRRAIAQMTTMVERMDRMTAEIEPKIGPVVDSLAAATADIREVAELARTRAPGLVDKADEILATTSDVAAKLSALLGDVQGGVEEARSVVERVRFAVDDARPVVDRILANVESATAKVDQESIARLNEALEEGKAAASGLADTLADVAALVQEHGPSLGKTMANARLASDQLKLATVEIRQSPWRLLYRPTTKELEAELVYGAAQSYAAAVSDLRASIEAVERLNGAGRRDPGVVMAATESLHGALVRYEAMEREFLRLLGAMGR